jgi:rubrerythrin
LLYYEAMIKKKGLIEILYKALDSEEEANNHFYTYTINSLKYYKWLSEDKKEEIMRLLTRLRSDSQRHKSMVDKLIQHVEEGNKNVF